ncbi:MAG: porin family protein [Bryobacterales bacterium]|nr:porin family protein [Bryobacterales bacterium]MBV9398302.1 porin family protein [Bryobacterales bacterium]
MKTQVLLAGSMMLFGAAAYAQEVETPKVEVGLNYSYSRIYPGGGLTGYNANGGYGYAEYNVNKVLGLVADLGASSTGNINGVSVNNTTFEYLFGPRFNWRHSRFTPYVQTLFGGMRFTNGINPVTGYPGIGTSQNNFAAAFGGGLDVAVNNHLALKPFQVDYLITQVSPGSGIPNNLVNGLRYSAGVVFRFGSK